jgi:hypothetical protein
VLVPAAAADVAGLGQLMRLLRNSNGALVSDAASFVVDLCAS